jgi:hypothetical protein
MAKAPQSRHRPAPRTLRRTARTAWPLPLVLIWIAAQLLSVVVIGGVLVWILMRK